MLNKVHAERQASQSAIASSGGGGGSRIWLIVTICLVIILAGLGTFSYFYYKNKSAKTTPTPSPTITLKASPSSTQSPTTSPIASPSPTDTTKVKIFMIALGDNGASGKLIGCGDSAVAVEREVPATQAVLKAAIEQLISVKDATYGESGLTNPLSQSSLNFVSATIDDNGKATVRFSGNLSLPGECGDARIQAQFEETALQFSTVQSVDIFINNTNLKDLISQEG